MGAVYVMILIFTAVGAVLSIPIFYLWAWAMGPATKHLGRKWAEGWFEEVDRRGAENRPAGPLGLVEMCPACREPLRVDGICPVCWKKPSEVIPAPPNTPAPAPTWEKRLADLDVKPKFTITGKQVR